GQELRGDSRTGPEFPSQLGPQDLRRHPPERCARTFEEEPLQMPTRGPAVCRGGIDEELGAAALELVPHARVGAQASSQPLETAFEGVPVGHDPRRGYPAPGGASNWGLLAPWIVPGHSLCSWHAGAQLAGSDRPGRDSAHRPPALARALSGAVVAGDAARRSHAGVGRRSGLQRAARRALAQLLPPALDAL